MATDDRRELIADLSDETPEAHVAFMLTVDALGSALAKATRPHEREQWRARAGQELSEAIGCLTRHCAAADSLGGLIAEMIWVQGESEFVTRLRLSREAVFTRARSLLGELEGTGQRQSPKRWLRRLDQLADSLHAQEAREIDVIYELYWRDPVGGD